MRNSVLILNLDGRWIRGRNRLPDLSRGVVIKHEYLSKMGSGGPKQVKTIGLRLGQGLLMSENNSGGVILDFAERYKTLAFKLQDIACCRQWTGESLDVAINRWFWVLTKNSIFSPVT